tara:strand:+ start:7359 stop:7538 length:180 start_codon:yes stop_codon:yes gene_type:complete
LDSLLFLSRLFGGAVSIKRPVSPEHFLSRLFGGEEWWVFAQTIELFLSRLFGGEASREH